MIICLKISKIHSNNSVNALEVFLTELIQKFIDNQFFCD